MTDVDVREMERNPLLAKIVIEGTMRCETGLHIGASPEAFQIGGIDSPVVSDPLTGQPYVPGSSLKGKLRSLTERALNLPLRKAPGRHATRIHRCDSLEQAWKCPVCRIFGYLPMGEAEAEKRQLPSPLRVRDLHLTEDSARDIRMRISSPLKYTEWKSENALDRITGAANPRQIERVPREAEFRFEMTYDVSEENLPYVDGKDGDLATVLAALRLLQDDALGGHGSRGYGKVSFAVDRMAVRRAEYYRCDEGQQRETFEHVLLGNRKPVGSIGGGYLGVAEFVHGGQ